MKKYIQSLFWLYLISLAASLISFILSFMTIFYSEFSTLLICSCVCLLILIHAAGGYLIPKSCRNMTSKQILLIVCIYSVILCLFYFLAPSGIPLVDTISAFSIYFLFTAVIFIGDVVSAGLYSIPSFFFIVFNILIVMISFYTGYTLRIKHDCRRNR